MSKNVNDSQFVVKLTDMMRVVSWSDDGNFYKTKSAEKSMSFKNEIFRKGNQKNFFLIQRRRKFKDLQNFQDRFEKQCEQLITQVNNKRQLTPQMKQTIISLLEYKFTSHVNIKRMKCEIEALIKQLKDSRNQKIKNQCKFLKSQLLASIMELNKQSKKIDEFISRNFLKESQETKESLEPILNEKQLNHSFEKKNDQKNNEMKNKPLLKDQFFIQTDQNRGYELKQNLQSYKSFQYLYEDLKPKRQLFYIEPKIYLPFTSQNSFMILPSYIPAPSHLTFENRMSFYHQSHQVQFDQNNHKNLDFYDSDDDNASMSFVKPGDQGFEFPEVN